MAQATLLNNIGNAQFNKGEYQDADLLSTGIRDPERLKLVGGATSHTQLAMTNVKLDSSTPRWRSI